MVQSGRLPVVGCPFRLRGQLQSVPASQRIREFMIESITAKFVPFVYPVHSIPALLLSREATDVVVEY